MTPAGAQDEELPRPHPIFGSLSHPIVVDQNTSHILRVLPLTAPLLIANEVSEIRDFCANERTYLSYLRLSTYLAVVAAAITLSFHLKHQPTEIEKRVSLPLGILFWIAAVACLGNGIARYTQVIEGYGKRRAIVQSGLWTQVIFGVIAALIIGTCLFFVIINANAR